MIILAFDNCVLANINQPRNYAVLDEPVYVRPVPPKRPPETSNILRIRPKNRQPDQLLIVVVINIELLKDDFFSVVCLTESCHVASHNRSRPVPLTLNLAPVSGAKRAGQTVSGPITSTTCF